MAEIKKEIELEIAHVLLIDIVGYSKLLINEQRRLLELLNQIVHGTEQFRTAEKNERLVAVPAGDGMALVFYNTPEAPVECALEISRALKQHPELELRMGVNSGPVSGVVDVSGRANVAGAGINMAQRVMDCGDAGHILVSRRVAEDLEQYGHWQPCLHDLGECEVKHGVRVRVVNLYTDELGNPEVPPKLKAAKSASRRTRRAWVAASLLAAALIAGAILFFSRSVTREKSTAGAPTLPAKSIAVLPFENRSAEPENAFFADGVQDEILTNLARIADLKVISRTSVMQYKSGTSRNLREISKQLGVAHLLEGSVQRAGNKVRVNAQLIDTRQDVHVWAQTYDRNLKDVFAIQSEIAKAIADQLRAQISPGEKQAIERPSTSDLAAFDLYTRAKNLILASGLSDTYLPKFVEALDLLKQAVARDPSFLLAHCLLASTHDRFYFFGIDHTPERLVQAEEAVQAAFDIRPGAGEAHFARAEHRYFGYLDYDGALAALEIAERTLPNDPRIFELRGYIARRQGKNEEGLRNLERAIELDPRNLFTIQQIALSYHALRRYPEMRAMLDRSLEIDPDNLDSKAARAYVDLDGKADVRPLRTLIETSLAQNPGAAIELAEDWILVAFCERDAVAADRALAALGDKNFDNDIPAAFGRGLVALLLGQDPAEARAEFTQARAQKEESMRGQQEYGPAFSVLGLIDAFLGRKEEALRQGRRGVELLPLEKDAIRGAATIGYLAIIAAWTGEKELALEQLAIAAKLSTAGVVTYGRLRLHPYWDPLRDDPRFEKIVASLAPK